MTCPKWIDALQPVSPQAAAEFYEVARAVIAHHRGSTDSKISHNLLIVQAVTEFEPWEDDLVALEIWTGPDVVSVLLLVDHRERIFRDATGWQLPRNPLPLKGASAFGGRVPMSPIRRAREFLFGPVGL